jgi:hypothetical protein
VGIFQPIELGRSRSTKGDGFFGGKALEQRKPTITNGRLLEVQFNTFFTPLFHAFALR